MLRKINYFVMIMIILDCFIIKVVYSENINRKSVEKRIYNIVNGLKAFNPKENPFSFNIIRNWEPKPLKEEMEKYKIPGVSLVVINDLKIHWIKSYGILNAELNNPVNKKSIFQAASTSKLVISAIILNLVEKGILDLDQNVNDYLKNWKIPKSDFTKKQIVTLRLLLTHQAGFPSTNFSNEEGKDPTLIQVLKGESPAINKPAIVEYIPGTKWVYSNIGYVIIQKILQDRLNKSLNQIASEIVFKPLGMNSSTFNYPLSKKNQKSEAMPHDVGGKSRTPLMHATALAQGGLMTTPYDMALLTIELMKSYQGKSNTLFSQKTAKKMFNKEADIKIGGISCQQGLGVFLFGKGENLQFLHPGSNSPGSTSWLFGFLEKSFGGIIMTNGVKGDMLSLEILPAIIKEYQ